MTGPHEPGREAKTRAPNPFAKPKLRVAATLVALAMIGLSPYVEWAPIEFKTTEAADLLGVLAKLFIVSLFVERGLEFLIELYRGADRDKLKHELKQTRELLALDTTTTAHQPEREALAVLEDQVAHYKAITIRFSLWSAFIFGLAMGLIGIRCLAPLVELGELSSAQSGAFHALDILLTGSLISGGSEGIHKMMRLYNRLMDDSAERIKEGGQSRKGAAA